MKNATNLVEQVRIQLATRSFSDLSQFDEYPQNRKITRMGKVKRHE